MQVDHPIAAPPISADRSGVSNLRVLGALMAGGAVVLPFTPDVGPLCPLRRITGVPCPACGMTTAMIALARGDLGASLAANPAGIVLALVVAAAFLPLFVRRLIVEPLPTKALSRWGPLALAPLWLFELHRYDHI